VRTEKAEQCRTAYQLVTASKIRPWWDVSETGRTDAVLDGVLEGQNTWKTLETEIVAHY
jgi:hypothetical protein